MQGRQLLIYVVWDTAVVLGALTLFYLVDIKLMFGAFLLLWSVDLQRRVREG